MDKNIFKKILIALCFIFVFSISNVFAEGDNLPITTSDIDTNIPIITLTGDSEVKIKVGDIYNDAGATALDDKDGDITPKIIIGGSVDTSKIGNYTITYDVSDLAGNIATQVSRIVIVEENIVISPENLLIDISVDVSSSCDVLDMDGISHSYSSISTDSYLGICALKFALDSNNISNVKLSNQYPSMGLFVVGFNNKDADSSSQYWALYKNGNYAETGLTNLPVSIGDTISFKLSDFAGVETGDSVVIKVNSLVATPSFLSAESLVDVPVACDVVDTNGMSHTYTAIDTSSYLGICALKAAVDSGIVPVAQLSNKYPSMGLFVTAFGDKEADPNSQYWALYKNGNYAETGLTLLNVTVDDVITIKLSDFGGVETGDSIAIKIKSLIPSSTTDTNQNNGSSSGGGSTAKEFSIDKAFKFLISKQNNDGSYNGEMYTDWVAIALSQKGGESKEKIKEYLISNDIDSSVLTDYERRAMALMSLGISPYDGTDFDYIKKIIDSFDGVQFGDPSLVNDDIFAILVLKNAGFNEDDEIIKKDVSYIISQGNNGSWGSVDMTAAFVQALSGLENMDGVSDSISNAKNFILSNSLNLNNPFTASWVMQSGVETIKSKEYLISIQNEDGGINIDGGDVDSSIWATSYTIPAILNKNWDEILKNFNKIIYENETPRFINNIDIESKEPVLYVSEIKTEDFVVSTEVIVEKPIVKTQIVKTNIKKDVISTENIESQIEPIINVVETIQVKENNTFLGVMNNFWLKISSIFKWLFG